MIRYLRLYRSICRTFGFRLRPIGTFLLLQLHRLINGVTRGLDHIFFPSIRKKKLDRPIFILGNPRSGTTFVHRFLLHSERLCAFQLWEMLFPAVTARRIFGGLVDRLAPLNPARYHSSDAHETSLRDVETDEPLWLFHAVRGPFVWAYFHAWQDTWGSDLCRSSLDLDSDPAEQARFYRYMEGSWKRNMVAHDKPRVIAKTPMLTSQAPDLLRRYPGAKLIYLMRDPLATIPSGMSLLTGVLSQSYDVWGSTSEEDRARYLENLYQASCHTYRSFHEMLESGTLSRDQVLVVPYPALINDLENTVRRISEFCELDPVPEFWERLAVQAEKQKSRKSSHKYSLEKFGLDEDRIREDLKFVYDNYDV